MFPASLRFTKKDFENIKTRIIFRGDLFDVAKKEDPIFKVSCVISKKRVGKAVDRNKARRRILHAFNAYIKTNPLHGYFIFYPKPIIVKTSYQKIEEEITKASATLHSIT
jgi:ribonuclease P protein component